MTPIPLPTPVVAVVFDLDGTMYRQAPVRRAMAAKLISAHVLRPVQGQRVMRVIRAYRRAQEDLRGSEGVDPGSAQLAAAAASAGVSIAETEDIIAQWMDTAPLDIVARYGRPGLRELLTRLRNDGVRLGVLSDYPADQKLAALGLREFFDVVLCAQDRAVAAFKPSPRGIHVALERLGAVADSSLYVGDRPEVDAVAARAAGAACVIVGSARNDADDDHHAVPDFSTLNRTLQSA